MQFSLQAVWIIVGTSFFNASSGLCMAVGTMRHPGAEGAQGITYARSLCCVAAVARMPVTSHIR